MPKETPTLKQTINETIGDIVVNMHTALPAKITKVSAGKVNLQPLLKRKLVTGALIDLPVITNVPVMFQRSGRFVFSFPLAVGDTGLVVFAERSMDNWLVQGGTADPADPRKFDLSDGIFFPGLYPFNNPPEYNADKMILKLDDTEITMGADGKIALKNSDHELLGLIDELLDALLTAKVNTAIGPQSLVPPTLFTDIKTKLATLKE